MAILDSIYMALDDAEAFAQLPVDLAAEIGARSVVIQHLDKDWSFVEATYTYYTDEMRDHYVANAILEGDVWAHYAFSPERQNIIQNLGELVPVETYRKSRYYNEFIRHFGDDSGHCIGAGIALDSGFVTLGAHRAFGAGAFTAEEVALLAPLTPHVRRLFQLRSRLAQMTLRARLAEGGLDALSNAILLTDGTGRITVCNAAAKALLNAGDGLRTISARLVALHPPAQAQLAEGIRLAATRSQGGALHIPRASGRADFRLTVAPWPIDGRMHVVILIDDPSRADPGLAKRLTDLFALTPAESETVTLLTEGLTPEEIAERRQVGVATVRTQIQQALRKTETRRATQLVSLAARLIHRSVSY